MAKKTNKEILEQFGDEMGAAYDEKEERLMKLYDLNLSEPVRRQAREDIVKTFYDKMEEIKRKPWYEEALKSARKEWALKHKMHKAEKDYLEAKEAYEKAQVDYRWEVEEKTEVKDTKEELYWDKEKILENLKENCVKVEENVEMMWHKWKKVHINLPKIEWKFEWFKFEYFVSNESVLKKDFESNPELEKKSYSMEEVWGLLKAMNKYMQAMGVETDWDMDYENDLKYWKTDNYGCDAWDCLKNIAWLDYWYWLKDKDLDWVKNSRAEWNCNFDYCDFDRDDSDSHDANLFLRLS